MNSMYKKISIIILILILLMAFAGSYNSLSIDNLAYVVALGIDTSDSNKLKVSFQFSKPSAVSESGTTEEAPSILDSVDASSISNAINLMNTYIGKQLNLSHCKVVVISEEFATQGISSEIYTLINNTQVRPSTNIVVSRCEAKYYIENSKPSLESLVTKYYEIFPNSSQYTGYTSNATIGDFFNNYTSTTSEPFAILGGITQKASSYTTLDAQKDSSVKSNESSIDGERETENIGLAVFKNDKLIGELNAIENICFLIMKNNVKSFLISIPDPEDSTSDIDIYLTPNSSPNVTCKIVNGSPYVQIKGDFSGRILSVSSNSDYLDSDRLNSISNSCNSYLESAFSNYLYKTSKDFKSDINGIGKYCSENFSSDSEFKEYNWLENYKNSYFDVNVNSNIKSSLILTQT